MGPERRAPARRGHGRGDAGSSASAPTSSSPSSSAGAGSAAAGHDPERARVSSVVHADDELELALVEVRFTDGTRSTYVVALGPDGEDATEHLPALARLVALAGADTPCASARVIGVEQSNYVGRSRRERRAQALPPPRARAEPRGRAAACARGDGVCLLAAPARRDRARRRHRPGHGRHRHRLRPLGRRGLGAGARHALGRRSGLAAGTGPPARRGDGRDARRARDGHGPGRRTTAGGPGRRSPARGDAGRGARSARDRRRAAGGLADRGPTR